MFTSKNKKILISFFSLFLLFILLIPVLSLAVDINTPDGIGLVKCGNSTTTPTAENPSGLLNPCDFTDFIGLINGIIDWVIGIAGVIFTISCAYGGYLYLTSGDKPGNRDKAKNVLLGTLTGFVIILIAWVVVYTLLTYLVPSGSYIFKFIK